MYVSFYVTIFRKSSHQLDDDCDMPFVEQPSKDFFCPVTYGLLLQPHLTSCCGKHLSHEAATLIERKEGTCPLCNEIGLKTMLDKGFQRKVKELRVFCRHKDIGCGWQGKLSDLDQHLQSCSYSDHSRYTLNTNLLTYTVIILFIHIVKKRLLKLNKTKQASRT